MSRTFYYHPSRQVEVDKVIAAGMLGARPGEKAVPNGWMPTTTSDGKPLLGFWVEDVLPDEWMKIKEISAAQGCGTSVVPSVADRMNRFAKIVEDYFNQDRRPT